MCAFLTVRRHFRCRPKRATRIAKTVAHDRRDSSSRRNRSLLSRFEFGEAKARGVPDAVAVVMCVIPERAILSSGAHFLPATHLTQLNRLRQVIGTCLGMPCPRSVTSTSEISILEQPAHAPRRWSSNTPVTMRFSTVHAVQTAPTGEQEAERPMVRLERHARSFGDGRFAARRWSRRRGDVE